MSFGISFLSDSNPQLVTVSGSKDRLTCSSKLLSIGLPDLLNASIKYREVIVNPNSLKYSIFIEIDAENLRFVSL